MRCLFIINENYLQGINRVRRYLLEWQSFLCRYIPVGILEQLPQKINDRPTPYVRLLI